FAPIAMLNLVTRQLQSPIAKQCRMTTGPRACLVSRPEISGRSPPSCAAAPLLLAPDDRADGISPLSDRRCRLLGAACRSDVAATRSDQRAECGNNMMADEIADDDFERQFELRRTDPAKFLELMNKLVERRPDDANAYFSRHQAWTRLGRPDPALADLDTALALEDHYVTQRCRGQVLHAWADTAKRSPRWIAPSRWTPKSGRKLWARCSAPI